MGRRKLTVDRYAEIKRRLAQGRGVREISRALGCSRRLVREIQRGSKQSPEAPQSSERSVVDAAGRLADDHP